MRERFKARRIGKIVVFVLVAGTAFTAIVMSLWNWLMPEIFGLTAISFWQALGLLILSKILFGGGKPGFRGRRMSRDKKEMFMRKFGEMYNSEIGNNVEPDSEMSN